jgi:Membrane-associated lipoprotein involved in thiamine biosynthesis
MKKQVFLFLFLLVFLFSCKKQQEYSETRFLMDTICEIKVVSDNEKFARKVLDETFKEVERIGKIFGYSKDSEVEKINSFSGVKPVVVSSEVFNLIKKSIEISENTDGAFDITVGILSDIWGFKKFSQEKNFVVPKKEEIEKALSLVGYKNIKLDEKKQSVFLTKRGMEIDLGGIAKGYSIMRTKEILEKNNFRNFLINFGGDIYVKGKNKDGKPWKVAVQHPRNKNEFLTILNLTDISIVTSGDYERYFVVDGARYHHIFDPKTGYPKNGIVSVTILHSDSTIADALSTGIFVLGEKKVSDVLKKYNFEYIIVKEENGELKTFVSSGLKNFVKSE